MIFRLSEKLGIPKIRIIYLNSKTEKTKEKKKTRTVKQKYVELQTRFLKLPWFNHVNFNVF